MRAVVGLGWGVPEVMVSQHPPLPPMRVGQRYLQVASWLCSERWCSNTCAMGPDVLLRDVREWGIPRSASRGPGWILVACNASHRVCSAGWD